MRRTLDRLLDRQMLRPLRRLWAAEVDRMVREVRRGVGRNPDAGDYVVIRRRTQEALTRMLERVGTEMANGTTQTLTEGVRALARFMHHMGDIPGPLTNEAMVQGIVDTHRLHLAEMRFRSAASLAPTIDERVQKAIAKAQLEADVVTIADIQVAVGDVAEHSWGVVQRVVRTETAHAFNTAQVEGILLLEDEYPDIMKRWTELVDDATGKPMDNRVGDDSIALHGQLARPSALFTMHPHKKAPATMLGNSWEYPPNRPNDRAVCTPWRPAWGQRGWVWQGGRRVYLGRRRSS